MLLFLERLQAERIVTEGVLDVPKVRQVGDELLPRIHGVVQFGSQILPLLIIRHL